MHVEFGVQAFAEVADLHARGALPVASSATTFQPVTKSSRIPANKDLKFCYTLAAEESEVSARLNEQCLGLSKTSIAVALLAQMAPKPHDLSESAWKRSRTQGGH